jgi:hypothetical protein
LEELQRRNQVVLDLSVTLGSQGVPKQVPSTSNAPSLSHLKAPRAQMVFPIRLPSEAPPSEEPFLNPMGTFESQGAPTQVLTISEYPRLSPLMSTKVPMASKRERPGPATVIDVGPGVKRFCVATKADDADIPEHLWYLRALKLKWTPTSQEGKALKLL